MKKTRILIGCLGFALIFSIFVGLQRHKGKNQVLFQHVTESSEEFLSMDWLRGNWSSEEWQVIYTFRKEKSGWSIRNGETWIAKEAKVEKESTNKEIVLVSEEGTRFILKKQDDMHMKFQQLAKEGLVGATNSVEFVKK